MYLPWLESTCHNIIINFMLSLEILKIDKSMSKLERMFWHQWGKPKYLATLIYYNNSTIE